MDCIILDCIYFKKTYRVILTLINSAASKRRAGFYNFVRVVFYFKVTYVWLMSWKSFKSEISTREIKTTDFWQLFCVLRSFFTQSITYMRCTTCILIWWTPKLVKWNYENVSKWHHSFKTYLGFRVYLGKPNKENCKLLSGSFRFLDS